MARDQGIEERHARSCPRGDRCNCKPTYQAQVWDAQVCKRITRSFATITAARLGARTPTPRCAPAR